MATKSKIHLICNTWISSNGYAIWGVQTIFFNLNYHKQDFLIDLKQFRGDYWNEIQTGMTLQVANEYGIAKNLEYVVMNNILSNNMLVCIMEFIFGK